MYLCIYVCIKCISFYLKPEYEKIIATENLTGV